MSVNEQELDDICSRIAHTLDVYEFLDILDYTMEDLVVVLKEQINERIEEFQKALD